MRIYLSLFTSFFTVGAFTLGGGYAMLPLIEREVVKRRQWLPDAEYLDALAIAQSFPGPVALNISVFTGYRVQGFRGAVAAAAGIAAPAFMAMILIVTLLLPYRDEPFVERVFIGLRPAVCALLLAILPGLCQKARLGPLGFLAAVLTAFAVAQTWYPVSAAWLIAGVAAWSLLRPSSGDTREPPP